MKTFVIIVSEYFPNNHVKKKEKTNFVNSILTGLKKHTIRSNYDLWKKRFQLVDSGEAYISIRIWTGLPYRSKQKEIKRLFSSDGIGIEKLQLSETFNGSLINGFYQFNNIEEKLAENDGLSFQDFKNWFSSYTFSKPLAIIHFTKFRYGKH